MSVHTEQKLNRGPPRTTQTAAQIFAKEKMQSCNMLHALQTAWAAQPWWTWANGSWASRLRAWTRPNVSLRSATKWQTDFCTPLLPHQCTAVSPPDRWDFDYCISKPPGLLASSKEHHTKQTKKVGAPWRDNLSAVSSWGRINSFSLTDPADLLWLVTDPAGDEIWHAYSKSHFICMHSGWYEYISSLQTNNHIALTLLQRGRTLQISLHTSSVYHVIFIIYLRFLVPHVDATCLAPIATLHCLLCPLSVFSSSLRAAALTLSLASRFMLLVLVTAWLCPRPLITCPPPL